MDELLHAGHKEPWTIVDLFAGAGGLTCGAHLATSKVLLAIEQNLHAAATYSRNNPWVKLLNADISEVNPKSCMKQVGLSSGCLDLLVAGPPCQGFSESNRRTRTLANPRNHLYTEVFRFIEVMRPKWFVIENVAGLRTLGEGRLLRKIVAAGEELGYRVGWQMLCAADFGVPQVRRRIFIVGNRLGVNVSFPEATHGPEKASMVTVRAAIDDLPILRNGASDDELPYRRDEGLSQYQQRMRRRKLGPVQGNLVTRSSALIIERYRHVGPGRNWRAIPDGLMENYDDPTRCHTGIYYRLQWDQPSKVLGNFRKNMLIHPSQSRGLSIREAARLQSFPDWYEFIGSIGFQQQQVADAVPPFLAAAVIRHLAKTRLCNKG